MLNRSAVNIFGLITGVMIGVPVLVGAVLCDGLKVLVGEKLGKRLIEGFAERFGGNDGDCNDDDGTVDGIASCADTM